MAAKTWEYPETHGLHKRRGRVLTSRGDYLMRIHVAGEAGSCPPATSMA